MYNQFCKNLRHFNAMMNNDEESTRKQLAGVLLPLTDVKTYIGLKNSGNEEYKKIAHLIYCISQYSKDYPTLNRLVWELWAYGFDMEESDESQNYGMEEVAKLADLMMSTHYFV